MDETQIVETLKQNVPTPEPEVRPEPEITEPEPMHNGLPLETALARNELFDYFDIKSYEKRSPEVVQWVDTVLEWAKETAQSSELAEVLRVIGRQERIMGSNSKPGRLFQVYKYIRLHNQSKAIDEKMRALYG